jgi:hypothetical protein
MMIVLNFSHPLTAVHLEEIQALTGEPVEQVVVLKTQFDPQQPFVPQVSTLMGQVGFTPQQWQTTRLLVNPPSLNVIAATVLAELHGRMGYFPAILRMKPIPDTTPPQFEVAEVINLQAVRDAARTHRW